MGFATVAEDIRKVNKDPEKGRGEEPSGRGLRPVKGRECEA